MFIFFDVPKYITVTYWTMAIAKLSRWATWCSFGEAMTHFRSNFCVPKLTLQNFFATFKTLWNFNFPAYAHSQDEFSSLIQAACKL